jgi:TrwC relaxase
MSASEDIERAFSKRRQAIEEAARTHGYKTPKGMELAALRTRREKQEAKLDGLFRTWQAEARALGFELNRDRYHTRPTTAATERSHLVTTAGRFDASAHSAPMPARVATVQHTAAQLGSQLGHALRSLDQPSGMAGIKVRLHQSDRERERE